MKKSNLKKVLVEMIKNGESARNTAYNLYIAKYDMKNDEYEITRYGKYENGMTNEKDTDKESYPASEIDKLTEA